MHFLHFSNLKIRPTLQCCEEKLTSWVRDINGKTWGDGTLSEESEWAYHQSRTPLLSLCHSISPQAYDDYLDDVLSLDLATEPVSEKSLHSTNMLDFLVKEEPLGEDDLKAQQKDRQKKDNHNMSENIFLSSPDFCLQQDSNNFILWASNGQQSRILTL